MSNVKKFNEPDVNVKSVLCYFNGKFPKKMFPLKDITLPKRLFPNAKFFIRCKDNIDTKLYLKSLYNDVVIEFIDEDFNNWGSSFIKNDIDVIYAPWIEYCKYGDVLVSKNMKFHQMLLECNKPVYLFINDIYINQFIPIDVYLKTSKQNIFNHTMDFTYSNLHILVNDTPFVKSTKKHWWEDKIKQLDGNNKQHTVYQLSDKIIYDLPHYWGTLSSNNIDRTNESYSKKQGVWVGTVFDIRLKHLNKIFVTPDLLNLKLLGVGSHKLNLYGSDNEKSFISHNELPKLFSEHDYSIYFARGKFINIISATFYEPLLNGLPIFMDIISDPHKEIFPDIDCYYSNEHELKQLVDSTNLKDLWYQQIKHLF